MLCVFAGNAGAEDELPYPQKLKLKCKDWVVDKSDIWMEVGKVNIWNTKNELKIKISNLISGYKMSKIAIHVVQKVDCVYDILDRKLQHSLKLFDYQTNYLKDPVFCGTIFGGY